MTHVTSVPTIRVVGDIDTHKDLHMAAVVDRDDGRLLETKDCSTTRAGYRALLRWMRQHGALESVGIEGTGSYGAGIMRFLNAAGVTTHEVDRPDRSDRRRRGKSDAVDAEMAARAVISGRLAQIPHRRKGEPRRADHRGRGDQPREPCAARRRRRRRSSRRSGCLERALQR